MTDIPTDVIDWLRRVLAGCNRDITNRLSRNPNAPEDTFDMTWVDSLSGHSSPIRLPSGWLAKIETHFLGGMRHFEGWEIADIGVLVFVRPTNGPQLKKVALLQSKRLYPNSMPVRELADTDYLVGFGRLADPEDESLSLGLDAKYRFTRQSRYQQLSLGSSQVEAIGRFIEAERLKVYYQFYNPWQVPFEQQVPLTGEEPCSGDPELGVRIAPASSVHSMLSAASRTTPRLLDLDHLADTPSSGWRLEDFFCDELLGCREGNRFESIYNEPMFGLFNRRSGPISAAVAVTIEAPVTTG